MATLLYDKEGRMHRVKASRVKAMLENGYSVTKPGMKKAKPVIVDEPVDFMQGAADAEAEIREQAKEAGIGNYWNKNIDALKEELGL